MLICDNVHNFAEESNITMKKDWISVITRFSMRCVPVTIKFPAKQISFHFFESKWIAWRKVGGWSWTRPVCCQIFKPRIDQGAGNIDFSLWHSATGQWGHHFPAVRQIIWLQHCVSYLLCLVEYVWYCPSFLLLLFVCFTVNSCFYFVLFLFYLTNLNFTKITLKSKYNINLEYLHKSLYNVNLFVHFAIFFYVL